MWKTQGSDWGGKGENRETGNGTALEPDGDFESERSALEFESTQYGELGHSV